MLHRYWHLYYLFKTEDFYKDIANDAENWFDTFNYDESDERPLPIGKNEKVIALFKDELGKNIMLEFVRLRVKTYAYLIDDDSEHKKAKGTKKCVIKPGLIVKNYKDSLFKDKTRLKLQQIFKGDCHNVHTEEINMIALTSNDDKRLQTFDKITTHLYGTNAFKVCKKKDAK